MPWQLQEAKQRFSEVVRRALEEGPQVVTRHGEEVAVVVSMTDWQRTAPVKPDLIHLLLNGPTVELEIPRSDEPYRVIDLSE